MTSDNLTPHEREILDSDDDESPEYEYQDEEALDDDEPESDVDADANHNSDSEDLDDISDEELEAILRGPPSRIKQFIKFGSIGAVLLLTLYLFWGGGVDSILKMFTPDEVAITDKSETVADSSEDGADTSDEIEEILAKSTEETIQTQVDPSSQEIAEKTTDTLANANAGELPASQESTERQARIDRFHEKHKEDRMQNDLPGMPFDEFTKLIRAEIDENEITDPIPGISTDMLSEVMSAPDNEEEPQFLRVDSSANIIDQILFEPIVPTGSLAELAGIPLAEWLKGRQPEAKAKTPQEMPKEDYTVAVDSIYDAQYRSMIDSLNQRLSEVHKELVKVGDDQKKLENQISQNKDDEIADSLREIEVKKLAKIMEKMNPLDAAMLLSDKSSEDVVDILFKVKPRSAAKILEELPPQLGSQVTAQIIGK